MPLHICAISSFVSYWESSSNCEIAFTGTFSFASLRTILFINSISIESKFASLTMSETTNFSGLRHLLIYPPKFMPKAHTIPVGYIVVISRIRLILPVSNIEAMESTVLLSF